MNIAIVDDHLLLGQLLAANLERSISTSQVKVFTSGISFLSTDFSRWQPDLVVVDIIMPVIEGLDLIDRVKLVLVRPCQFIVVSSVTDMGTVKDALLKGAKGYVEKGAPLEEMLQAVQAVMNGKQYISQSLKDDLLCFMLTDQPATTSLSSRENDVLQRICAGRTSKEIAGDMNLSIHTIQLYSKAILRKFKLHRMSDVRVYALTHGLYKSTI